MRRIALVIAAGSAAAALALTARAGEGAAAPDGKPLFLKYKCSACHTIAAEGIKKSVVEGDEVENPERKPPDLSGVGLERDARWITQYLTKKEAIDGRRHEKKFRGSEADLGNLAAWLATLKAKDTEGAKAKKKNEE